MLLALPWFEVAEEDKFKHFVREAYGTRFRMACATLTLKSPYSLQWTWSVFLWHPTDISCIKQIEGTFPTSGRRTYPELSGWEQDVQLAQQEIDRVVENLGYKIVPQRLEALT